MSNDYDIDIRDALREISGKPYIVSEKKAPDLAGISVKDGVIYTIKDEGVLEIINLSNSEEGFDFKNILASLETHKTVHWIAVYDNLACIGNKSSIDLIDIADKNNPVYIFSLIGNSIFIEGNFAYIANKRYFSILDIGSILKKEKIKMDLT